MRQGESAVEIRRGKRREKKKRDRQREDEVAEPLAHVDGEEPDADGEIAEPDQAEDRNDDGDGLGQMAFFLRRAVSKDGLSATVVLP